MKHLDLLSNGILEPAKSDLFCLLGRIIAHFQILNCAQPKSVGLELHITTFDVPEFISHKEANQCSKERKMV
jgi:hypothetical protein